MIFSSPNKQYFKFQKPSSLVTMEKSLTTAPSGPDFQEPLGIIILFTILTWSFSKLQKLLPSSCLFCGCHAAKTTSAPVLVVDTKICKALNKNGDDEAGIMTYSEAEAVMRSIGLDFDQENQVVLKTISHDYISQLFHEDEPSLQEVEIAFTVFDDNSDGYIDASDLQRVLNSIGLGEGIGVKECEQMIARYDMNLDRRLDMMEFTKVLEASIC